MRLWIDADACPNPIKEIVFRASRRLSMEVVLVANRTLRRPASPLVRTVQVPQGADAADQHIVDHADPEDLVVTADIPLAARLVERGIPALDPRGELYTELNVRERLSLRNFMEEMRSAGQVSGGPAPFSDRDRHRFANALDRYLARVPRP